MRSLFWKIFLWFWLAMALVGAILFFSVGPYDPRPESTRWRTLAPAALDLYGQTAIEKLGKDPSSSASRGSLALYLNQLERTSDIRALFFDNNGEELAGRMAPPGLQGMIHRALETGDEFGQFGPGMWAAHRIDTADGRRFVMAGEMRPGRFPRPEQTPFQTWRLLAVFLAAGAVCYGLVRYLTTPISGLRTATRRFAEGDFAVRVGPSLQGRRDELGDLGHDFDQMAERIEALMAAQRRLLADVSHELRSPLARLSVALGLAQGGDEAETQDALDRIAIETARLNAMIGQLLTLSRLESGVPLGERNDVDLARLVREVAADAQYEAQGRDEGKVVQVVASCECAIDGAEELLRSALENVVRNALRYTDANTTVEISLRAGRGPRTEDDADSHQTDACVIEVRDHGPGVPEAELDTLFRPFYRVADARERETGGTGLGLAITERAVRLHGGSVRAFNNAGGGLTIEIRLPARLREPLVPTPDSADISDDGRVWA